MLILYTEILCNEDNFSKRRPSLYRCLTVQAAINYQKAKFRFHFEKLREENIFLNNPTVLWKINFFKKSRHDLIKFSLLF